MKVKKIIIILVLATYNCFSQGFDQDAKDIVKLYPPVTKTMTNPKQYLYKTKNGTTLTYSQSEGKMRFTKVDSLAEIHKLDQLDELTETDIYTDYTDGVEDAWVKGKLIIGNNTYSLYGEYVAEGYLHGVAYDKDNKVFGVLNWDYNDIMTATLKTQTKSYQYNFERQFSDNKKDIPAKPISRTSNTLKDILTGNNTNNKSINQEITGTGSSLNKNLKDNFYIDDFLLLHSLSDDAKVEQLKKWGWITEGQVKDGKDKLHLTFHKRRSALMSKIIFSYIQDKKTTKIYYEITMRNRSYINRFVGDAEKKGFLIVTDKQSVYKLISDSHTITISNSVIEFSEQYYTIKIE
jgi:hypothetical protein